MTHNTDNSSTWANSVAQIQIQEFMRHTEILIIMVYLMKQTCSCTTTKLGHSTISHLQQSLRTSFFASGQEGEFTVMGRPPIIETDVSK